MDHIQLRRNAKAALAGAWLMICLGTLIYLALDAVAGSFSIVALFIMGPISYGYIKFITKQVDYGQQDFNELFSGFYHFIDTMVAGIIVTVLIVVGCILLIVPGIIVATGLSQTFFIMADNPQISGADAIKQSWQMMDGHKMDYFVFMLGFIGWALLCIITLGILSLYVTPYMTASQLNYYRELKAEIEGIMPPTYKG